MATDLSRAELHQISGGLMGYYYLEDQFGTLVGLAFLAGALGSGAALGGAFVVGGLMLFDSYYNY